MDIGYYESTNPLTGDISWVFTDNNATEDDVRYIVETFISNHEHEDYELVIQDAETFNDITVKCLKKEMPGIAEYIFNIADGNEVKFINEDSDSKQYQIGFPFKYKEFDFGYYEFKDKDFVKIKVPEIEIDTSEIESMLA